MPGLQDAVKVAVLVGVTVALVASSNAGAAPRYSDWSDPVNLVEVNSAFTDLGPAISKDELTLFFASNRPGGAGLDLWVTQRGSADGPWGPPMNLGPTVNTAGLDSIPALSRDEHWLFFNSDRAGGFGSVDVWAAYREHVHDAFGWQAPVNLGSGVNTQYMDQGATYWENEEGGAAVLYFNSNRPGGFGLLDIYASVQLPDGSWGSAAFVPEFSTPQNDQRAMLRADGLEAFLWGDRTGSADADIWVSTRESVSDPWGPPVNLGPPVNGPARDVQPYVSSDRLSLFFSSNRPGGQGMFDIYVSTRMRAGGT